MSSHPQRYHAIDALDEDARRAIYLAGREILANLVPPRTPLQAFEEFNENNLCWLVGRIRSRLRTNTCESARLAVANLQDHEVVTVHVDEQQIQEH